jgi:hypothetical protein
MNLQRLERLYKTEVEIVTQNQNDIYSSQIRVNQETTVGVDSGRTLYTVIRLQINVRERGKGDREQLQVNCLAVYHYATIYVSLCVFVSMCTIHNKNVTQT